MKNNIPQGYKATSLGIIPQEWEIKKLEEVGKLFSGLTYSPSDIQADGILVLRSSNIQKGQLVFEDNVFVNTPSYTPVKENDILICVRNGSRNLIGKTAMITKEVEGCAFGAFMSIFRSPINKYIFYLFGTELYRKYIYRNLGATINSINGNDLKRFRFPFPQIEEQQKIANILRTWDKSIEKQSQLIEKLELRKKGLMQQLLTGKRRLPGFSNSWKKVKLGDICSIKKGKTLSSSQVKEGIYPVIAGGKTIPYFHNEYTDQNVITISASGAYAGYVSLHENKIWASDCSVISTSGKNSILRFIYALLSHKQSYIYSLQIGGAQPHVFPKDITKINICVPTKEEQTAIAEVLTVADREIELAQQKLELLRQQKHGLMQQLLTGKKRVKL